ncbi:MAG: acyl carrier protein [Lachnospiraceae bacterium]|nr:acyl carrier protein [Lachnospiraceae bacterium]
MNYREKAAECFENLGIDMEEAIRNKYSLGDILSDSLSFIRFIVEMEETFGIEVGDDMLLADNTMTIESFVDTIGSIIAVGN